MTLNAYQDQLATARERFERDTAEHQMKILNNDGLYRHLRCQQPGTWSYGFDVVTWPGYLAVVGDAGDFVFSRVRDMFEFFESDSGRINPHYWIQKLQAPRPAGAEVYSERVARAQIREWLSDKADVLEDNREWDEEGPRGGKAAFELHQALQEQIFGWHELYSEEETRRLIGDFEHDGVRMDDSWEWDMREYDWQFLWCCHAIVWAIGQYRAQTREPVPA